VDIDTSGKDEPGKIEDNQAVVISSGTVAIGGQQNLDLRAKQIGAELSGPSGRVCRGTGAAVQGIGRSDVCLIDPSPELDQTGGMNQL